MSPNVLDILAKLVSDKEPIPNKFTKAMGKLIREAREELGLSQTELAEKIYRRQTTLSDIENGKIEVSAGALALLSVALEKPISYFYPPFPNKPLPAEELTSLEEQLLIVFRKIWDEHLQNVAIKQVRIIAEFDPTKMIWNLIDITASEKGQDAKIEEYIKEHKK